MEQYARALEMKRGFASALWAKARNKTLRWQLRNGRKTNWDGWEVIWGWSSEPSEKDLRWESRQNKKHPQHPQRLLSLCGCRWSNRPLGLLTLALFTLARPFKDTGWRQRQQLYLSLHGDGVLLTGNFPGSLPDEVVGSTSLSRSVCSLFLLWSYRNAQVSERQTKTEEERGAKRWGDKETYCLSETAIYTRTRGAGKQMRRSEKWKCRGMRGGRQKG